MRVWVIVVGGERRGRQENVEEQNRDKEREGNYDLSTTVIEMRGRMHAPRTAWGQ